jgi:hypothetical protein
VRKPIRAGGSRPADDAILVVANLDGPLDAVDSVPASLRIHGLLMDRPKR